MQKIALLLEGGMGPTGALASIGVFTFIVACIGLIIGPVSLFIAFVISLTEKDKQKRSPAYRVFIKIGLGGLIAGGISLLLTAVFCSWR